MNKSYLLLTLLAVSGLQATHAPQSTYRAPGTSNGKHEEHPNHSIHPNENGASNPGYPPTPYNRTPKTVYRTITKQDCDHNRALIAQAPDDVALEKIIEDINVMHGAEQAARFTCEVCNEYNLYTLLKRVRSINGAIWKTEEFFSFPCYNAVQNLKEAAANNYQQ